ncbi:PQQ-binding-like beta-propeller repeat protein, partial [Thermodesulfobacteriota bacterium]
WRSSLYCSSVNEWLPNPFKTKASVLSSPIIDKGIVYFGSTSGKIYAVDLNTGKEKWSFDKQDWRCSSVMWGDISETAVKNWEKQANHTD